MKNQRKALIICTMAILLLACGVYAQTDLNIIWTNIPGCDFIFCEANIDSDPQNELLFIKKISSSNYEVAVWDPLLQVVEAQTNQLYQMINHQEFGLMDLGGIVAFYFKAMLGGDYIYPAINLGSTTAMGPIGNGSTPEVPQMSQNYPNPFNPTTTISYVVTSADYITVAVYNTLGQKVQILVDNEYHQSGEYSLQLNSSQLASGVYYYQYRTTGFESTKKMVVLK